MACGNAHISKSDSLAVGAVQIMLGIFSVLMWYFLLVLYMGQIKGVFGKYEPLTYKTGCTLWGIFFIVSGVCMIKTAKNPTRALTISSLGLNLLCMTAALISMVLTLVELSSFKSVSYKNYGQAKLGREVSRVLLAVYFLEIFITLMHSIFMCGSLNRGHGAVSTSATEETETAF
ncbi:PREDICTED: membrane-spanning 4-domains subfamily A member 13 [Chinchilla lanigera]|uniref:Membrane spanning 4-domains A13 n=1 Tax=Chinchilla lanigera TaxID=34839 RepID=A0A8C2USM0_CHILA|nr:PREDICTED: membrane-spanning 4-domains subfamily A member 13 [Chinchilla lanigera]XP_005408158.1 PREDICTED: membrane-spanning 4-domains subfamily A member 13 [Chinchilla lanigera]